MRSLTVAPRDPSRDPPESCSSAHRACSATIALDDSASLSRGARKHSDFAFPMATATLRRNPAYRDRVTGELRKSSRNSPSLKAASRARSGAKWRGAKAASPVDGARRFHGQTSWQMSHPKTCGPMAARSRSGMPPRSSMVKYEMHRRESSVYRAPPSAGTMACVGHASMQRVHVPHRSGGGASGASSSETSSSPRKNHEPLPWLIRQVLRPIHPSPAARA